MNKLEFSCAKLIAKHPLPVKNVRKITQKWKQIWSWWPLWGFLKFHHGQPVNLAEKTGALLPTRYSLFLSIFPVFDIRNWSRVRAGQGSCSGSSDWNNFHEYSNVNTCRSSQLDSTSLLSLPKWVKVWRIENITTHDTEQWSLAKSTQQLKK